MGGAAKYLNYACLLLPQKVFESVKEDMVHFVLDSSLHLT